MEQKLIGFEYSNQVLGISNRRLQEQLDIATGISDRDTESGIDDQSRKRSRGEATMRANIGDLTDSDTKGQSDKRVRREV
jgi:hypothetical protein